MNTHRSLLAVCLGWLCLAAILQGPAARGATALQTTLTPETAVVGQAVTLRIQIPNNAPDTPVRFPPVDGLQFQFAGTGQHLTFVNGRQSHTYIVNFLVTAAAEGEYQIPAIPVRAGGKDWQTTPLKLAVIKDETQGRDMFLKLNLGREELYLGEVVPAEVLLYCVAPRNIDHPQLVGDGFVVHKRARHESSVQIIGNRQFSVVSFKMAISAAKAGKLELGPFQERLTMAVDTGGGFNPFFGGGAQLKEFTIRTDPVAVNVLPIPSEGRPAGFNGAVGQFNWRVEAGPKEVRSGDPITLRVTMSGQGNLDGLMLPTMDLKDFRIYQTDTKINPSDELGVSGTKVFEQVLIPQNSLVREIPALEFAYFNPKSRKFQTLASPAIPIRVLAADSKSPEISGGAVPRQAAGSETKSREDILHIKPTIGNFGQIGLERILSPGFVTLALLPAVLALGAMGWRSKVEKLERDPVRRERSLRQSMIAQGIQDLEAASEAGDSDRFFAIAIRLLEDQIARVVGAPPGAVTEEIFDHPALRNAVGDSVLAELQAVHRSAVEARYAPIRSARILISFVPRVRKLIQALSSSQIG